MSEKLTIDRVIKMAIKIEENGASFYRSHAEKVCDDRIRQTFLDLAVMEDHHATTFQNILKNLGSQSSGENTPIQGPDKFAYIESMADDFVFPIDEEAESDITCEVNIEHVLKQSIQKEKDSIVFYNFLKEMIEDEGDISAINEIIKEEIAHITTIRSALKEGEE